MKGVTMAEPIELSIDDLLLDQVNPRLDPVENQSAALEALVALNHEHVRNLMIDIKENGLDPGDSLYVMRNDDEANDCVVLDGNRRSSALIILSNPSLLRKVLRVKPLSPYGAFCSRIAMRPICGFPAVMRARIKAVGVSLGGLWKSSALPVMVPPLTLSTSSSKTRRPWKRGRKSGGFSSETPRP